MGVWARRVKPITASARPKINYPEDVVLRVHRSTGCRRSSRSRGVTEMQYLLMIYRNEADLGRMTADDRQKITAGYGAFTPSIIHSGHFQAGHGLQPPTTATPGPRQRGR